MQHLKHMLIICNILVLGKLRKDMIPYTILGEI